MDPTAAHARLPLLAEHDGLCHAAPEPLAPAREFRFSGCNQGRGRERCPRFPSSGPAIVRRFTVQAQTDATLCVLVSEEVDHIPVRWRQVDFSKEDKELLEPSADLCEVAQIRAFCSAYLERFS